MCVLHTEFNQTKSECYNLHANYEVTLFCLFLHAVNVYQIMFLIKLTI